MKITVRTIRLFLIQKFEQVGCQLLLMHSEQTVRRAVILDQLSLLDTLRRGASEKFLEPCQLLASARRIIF